MIKLIYILLIAVLLFVNNCLCWKPLASPASFSITQQHPALGQSSSSNSVSKDSIPAAQSSASITYHGNTFLNEHTNGYHAEPSQPSSVESSYESIEPRVLHSKDQYYGTKFFNELIPSTTVDAVSSQCSADKFAFEHEGTVQYEQTLPKLDQFTLCAWMRFTNHSGDHTVFTYALDDEQREIQFWVANTKGASYFSMAVHGQSLFRLNYPLKMRKWHHACASWNGKTGEWQLWVKAERVGRGFHNRIVGHVIDPNGILYSGGPSLTGPVEEDLHMEVTMIQMYKVALSAGKAHRDHKHHHVHHFNHDGVSTTTQPPPMAQPQQPLQTINPLLANGQIATRLRINLAGVVNPTDPQLTVPAQNSQHATIGTQFVSGQFSPAERFISQQLVGSQISPSQLQLQPQHQQQQTISTFKFPQIPVGSPSPTSYSSVSDVSQIHQQYLDTDGNGNGRSHILFKRNNNNKKESIIKSQINKREVKKHDKRALVKLTDGSIVDDSVIAANPYDFDGLAQFGAPIFQENLNRMMDIEDEIKQHDREPAEGEVQAVMQLCSICDQEPFQGAIIFAWKNAKAQTKHVLTAKSIGSCGNF